MRTVLRMLVLTAIAIALAPAAVSEEPAAGIVSLTPETGPLVAFKECYRTLPVADRPPDGIRNAPEEVSGWLVFPWGDGEAVVALTADALVPDRDGDGDLAQEEAVPRGENGRTRIELDLALPTLSVRCALELWALGGRGFRITNLTRMSGTVPVGDREMAVSLTDYLANGRYDDYRTTKSEEYWLCDHIHLDRDGDGEFARRIPPWGEDHSLARAFVIRDTLYECEVLDRGERLRFVPSARPLFRVDANTDRFTARFVSDELGCCSVPGGDGVGRLPAGSYVWDAYDYRVESARVNGLFWEEDGIPSFTLDADTVLGIRGTLRYELDARVDEDGDLLMRTVCYGPLGARVMIWLEGSRSIKPELTVETDEREILYRVTSNYC